MSDTQAASLNRSFSIGSVLTRSFGILFSNIISFTLVSLAAMLPLIAGVVMLIGMTTALQATGRVDSSIATPAFGIAIAAMLLLSLVFYPASGATIVNATFQHMRDGKARIWSSIKRAFARVFWVILLVLLIILALTGLGGVAGGVMAGIAGTGEAPIAASVIVIGAAVIAGTFLSLMWFVAIPACVVEQLGPIRSLGRSRTLTAGYRWHLLAVIVAIFVAVIVVSLLAQVLTLAGTIVTFIGSMLLQAMIHALWFIVPAVAYHDLRVTKEGVDIEKIAAIFD